MTSYSQKLDCLPVSGVYMGFTLQTTIRNPYQNGFLLGKFNLTNVGQCKKLYVILFYSSRKVWTIPQKMSTVESSYDINSPLRVFAKFWRNFVFFRNLIFFQKFSIFSKNRKFFKISLIVTSASFGRMKVLQRSFFQKLSILCSWNKINFPENF